MPVAATRTALACDEAERAWEYLKPLCLGDRYINRAGLGYASESPDTNLTKGAQPSRATAKGGRARSLESRTWTACSVAATSTQSSPELPL